MSEQRSIPKNKVARALTLANSGAKISTNYLKYRVKRAVTGNDDTTALHQANASDSYAALSRMKGAPLKVAQMLSIDQSLLPEAYAKEYAQAQYSAPPLSFPLVVNTFKKSFGKHPDQLYDTFSRKAVSGASIGQIHKASRGEQTFAVKVQYPGVADSLKSDLRLVRPFAMRLFDLKAAELDYFMGEVEERLLEETDYGLELERSRELALASSKLAGVKFPRFYPELSSKRVLTMDWIDGEHLDTFADGPADQAMRDRIGQALWDFYHHQVHELRCFHADPHPGNFIIDKTGTLWILDFGCVKRIPEDFYLKYFELLDARRVADRERFETCLRNLALILPADQEAERELLSGVYRESVEILSRPFREETFDFGDAAYLEQIRAFGERTSSDKRLKKLSSARGSPHSIYINRAYFGLYSLMSRLKARIRADLPSFLKAEEGKSAKALAEAG